MWYYSIHIFHKVNEFYLFCLLSVSNALDEAATALNKMRSKQGGNGGDDKTPTVEV